MVELVNDIKEQSVGKSEMCVFMCVPVVLQCFRESRAVVRVDACTAHLHILQASRKVTHIHFYCAEQHTCMMYTNYSVTGILFIEHRNIKIYPNSTLFFCGTLTYTIQTAVSHHSSSI